MRVVPSRCVLLCLVVTCLAVPAAAVPILVNVQVRDAGSLRPLAGATVRMHCSTLEVDVRTHTGIDGWAHLAVDLDVVGVPDVSLGALRLLPQPWPNPVTGEGLIPFIQPAGKSLADGAVRLYDLRGRCLGRTDLAAGVFPLGGGGLSAGVYVLRCVDRGSGTISTCRLVTTEARLHQLRFVAVDLATGKADPDRHAWPAQLFAHYPGHEDQELQIDLVEGSQDYSMDLSAQGGGWPIQTWLFGNDHGWNAAAADSGWVPAVADTGLVYDRCLIDVDGSGHALARWNGSLPDQEYCSDSGVPGRSSSNLLGAPPAVPVIWYDLDELPAGATIESAWLIVSPAPGSQIPCTSGRWHAAVLDVWNADAAWLDAPLTASCGQSPGFEHWRRTSWQYTNAATATAWDPPLSQRSAWEEYGIKSVPLTVPVANNNACRYDVTRAVQAWSDHRGRLANAGFVLANTTPMTSFTVAAGPAGAVAQRQPLLVVSWSQRPRPVPWNGYPLAFSFSTDDGDTSNLRYTQICEDHGVRMTIFVMRRGVRDFNPTNLSKVTSADLRGFVARGHEVGHHTNNHLTTWGLAEITWGETDSMEVELARDTWLEQIFGDGGQTAGQIDVLAYPAGGVSLWAIKNLINHEFILGRCAGNGEAWGLPAWGGSGWTTFLSWYDPVNLFNVAVVGHPEFVGYYKTDNYDYQTIRLKLRRYTAALLNQGQAALLTFCHSTKASPTFSYGIDYDELDWLLTAVQEEDLYWIGTLGDLAHCYRQTHLPVAPGDGIGIAAYDSLVQAGQPEFLDAWWVPVENSR